MEALLAYLESLHPLSPELKEHLRRILKYREVLKKEFVLKAGHICRNVCFVQKGLLRCFYIKEQHEVCSWFMQEGDVIISVDSFFDQRKSYEFIQALEDCELYGIEHRELEGMYRNFPEFNFVSRVLLQKYYTLSEQRLYSLRMQRAQERYDYLVKHHGALLLRVPAKYIASYLGITEVTLSKIKGRM